MCCFFQGELGEWFGLGRRGEWHRLPSNTPSPLLIMSPSLSGKTLRPFPSLVRLYASTRVWFDGPENLGMPWRGLVLTLYFPTSEA